MENRITSILGFHMDITSSPSPANAVLIGRSFDDGDKIDDIILKQNIGSMKNDFFIYYKVVLPVDSTITVIILLTLRSNYGIHSTGKVFV